jgi:hypothetical protein
MNPWDIDPNLYLRTIYRALRPSVRKLLRLAQGHAAPPADCRG